MNSTIDTKQNLIGAVNQFIQFSRGHSFAKENPQSFRAKNMSASKGKSASKNANLKHNNLPFPGTFSNNNSIEYVTEDYSTIINNSFLERESTTNKNTRTKLRADPVNQGVPYLEQLADKSTQKSKFPSRDLVSKPSPPPKLQNFFKPYSGDRSGSTYRSRINESLIKTDDNTHRGEKIINKNVIPSKNEKESFPQPLSVNNGVFTRKYGGRLELKLPATTKAFLDNSISSVRDQPIFQGVKTHNRANSMIEDVQDLNHSVRHLIEQNSGVYFLRDRSNPSTTKNLEHQIKKKPTRIIVNRIHNESQDQKINKSLNWIQSLEQDSQSKISHEQGKLRPVEPKAKTPVGGSFQKTKLHIQRILKEASQSSKGQVELINVVFYVIVLT